MSNSAGSAYISAIDLLLDGLVFVTEGKLQPRPARIIEKGRGPLVVEGIIVVAVRSVPVHNHTIHPRQLHEQYVIFENNRVSRIVRTDEWVVPGGDLPLTKGIDDVRIIMVHRPVPAPTAAVGFADKPGHVVNHDLFGR